MRVTGGELGGRRLRVPRSGLRPTSDRVRESVFARLDVEDACVLDLYAGSGSLGIEAISRGAASATFVERAGSSLGALRDNVASLLEVGQGRIVASDAVKAVEKLASEGRVFDLVLLDPPYAGGEIPRALAALAAGGIVQRGGVLVVESGGGHPVADAPGFERLDERRYGDTLISRFTASGPDGAGAIPIPFPRKRQRGSTTPL